MNRSYSDLLALTTEPPLWYQDGGVPRWAEFGQEALGVYWRLAALYRIQCQDCGARFNVMREWDSMDLYRCTERNGGTDVTRVEPSEIIPNLYYGDPPHHGGCVGETMNSESVRVIKVLQRDPVTCEPVELVEFAGLALDEDQ